MKKILMVLVTLFVSSAVYAHQLYDYKNMPINNSGNIRQNGCNEHVQIPAKSQFNISRMLLGAGAVSAAILPAMLLDPYIVKIDGVNYVLVKDRADKNWSEKDLLGFEDPKTNRFESLIKLNSDGDHSKVSSAELKKAGVRFVRMNSKGVLLVNDKKKDYDLNKVDYIDIINLKRTANSEATGIFGHFTVYLKTSNPNKRAVVGYVTYETNEKIQVLFK
ncbi:MAG: hypothetical protein K6E29_03225 [Cyanobacteria bacterium RUI128]|nr:hypothetical protein [Cyanobacteria bacterium RUI128]